MKYLEANGIVYRMTENRYRAFLQDIADGNDPVPAKFGKHVCELEHKDAEDIDPQEAHMYLTEEGPHQ